MKKLFAWSLGWLLLWQGGAGLAGDVQWRPANSGPRVAVQPAHPEGESNTLPAVIVGRPIPLEDNEGQANQARQPVRSVAFQTETSLSQRAVVRAQSPPLPGPPPPPPPGPDGLADEKYNCGVVTAPAGGIPIWDKAGQFFGGIKNGCCGPAGGQGKFQSDQCFPNFISPVTNPFLFEDPRSLTEVRPIIMYQSTPDSNWIFKGGDMEFFGLQARLALSPQWSIVMNKLGWIAMQPNDGPAFPDSSGFAEINIGPKFTFLRNDSCGTLGAVGLTFQIPTGPNKVLQNTGELSLTPYLSMGQTFGRSSYGSFNALGTFGWSVATDSQRSDYLFTSLHLDYNVGNANKIYPLIELNWFHYTEGGNARNLTFEGRDLANIGSIGVGGNDNLSIAVGTRYKFSEMIQTGIAAEFPLNGRKDLLDFRLTFDMIFRY